MAFFRKTQKTDKPSKTRPASEQALKNQSKWDELERLVRDNGKLTETASTKAESDFVEAKEEFSSMDLGAESISDSNLDSLNSDLKLDLPEDSKFVDVTPEAPRETVKSMPPSAHFNEGARSERAATSESINLAQKTNASAPTASFVSAPPPTNRPDRADIGAMRLDVARISADIQSGEELYRRAQQRIENLTGFVERAEIDFSMLNRLEPENRRLKARNRTIEREIEANVQKMNVLRADLEDREQRLSEKTRVYEATLGKLSVAQKSLQEYERALGNSRESSDRNALNAERLQTSLDVERRESLAQDCSDYRHQAESVEKEADELRKSLATAQTQNNAMKAEMLSLHEDIRTFKSQSEFSIISREDEMAALQQQVDHLTKQLEIKDEIVRNAARDVQELRKVRTAQDLERERLEAQIETQAFQLDEANSEILKTKQDVTDFDRRYRDVATALSVAQSRRMSNAPAETPDIQPAPTQETPQLTSNEFVTPYQTTEFEDLSGEEIEERIMDFRLGLRKDI